MKKESKEFDFENSLKDGKGKNNVIEPIIGEQRTQVEFYPKEMHMAGDKNQPNHLELEF